MPLQPNTHSFDQGDSLRREILEKNSMHDNMVYEEPDRYSFDEGLEPTNSHNNYASTVSSRDDIPDDVPEYEVLDNGRETFWTDAVPATSPEFAELFPSSRKLSIRHDDATLDGNMNLRVDTRVTTPEGRKVNMTLFHLRMHDLRGREFSLRRYCRDSGREICHSCRKQQESPTSGRPGIQRSLSNAIATIRSKAELKSSRSSSLKRQDSGYDSIGSEIDEDEESPSSHPGRSDTPISRDIISLEFSNYAHVEVKRKGIKADKRYEFEYWGIRYAWQRVTKKVGESKDVAYHLVRRNDDHIVAHLMPMALSEEQVRDELDKGGWIPPMTMWISDHKIIQGLADVADVVVASGLISMVDDSIRRRFHSKGNRQLIIPIPKATSMKPDSDYMGPKRLIDEAFGRHKRSNTAP